MLSLWDTSSYLHHQFGGRYEQFFQPVNYKCLHLDDSQSLCMKAPAPLLQKQNTDTISNFAVVDCACAIFRNRERHACVAVIMIISLVSRHQIFRARLAALSKNRVWTPSLVELGCNYTSVSACCSTNQIAQVE